MEQQKKIAQYLAKEAAEHFKDSIEGLNFNYDDQNNVLQFLGSRNGQPIGHQFDLNEWSVIVDKHMEHHALENVLGQMLTLKS